MNRGPGKRWTRNDMEDRHNLAMDLIKQGMGIRSVAREVGVARGTIYGWLARENPDLYKVISVEEKLVNNDRLEQAMQMLGEIAGTRTINNIGRYTGQCPRQG